MRRHTAKALPLLLASCALVIGQTVAAPPEGKGNPNKGNPDNGQGQGQDKGQGKGRGKPDKDSHDAGANGASLRYAGITVTTARSYAHEYGLSGYSQLPPGIRKNLARGKPLPPGIAKKMVPGPMLARLPAYPGYEWRIAGSDLVLVAIATAVVADVLLNVFD